MILVNVWGALSLLALIAVAVDRRIARARTRKALSYCRRDADGVIYVQDPQKGTWHRLDKLLVQQTMKEAGLALPEVSARQKRKVRRRVRQALHA